MSASADPNHGDVIFWNGAWWPVRRDQPAAPLWAAAGGRHQPGVRGTGRAPQPDALRVRGRRRPSTTSPRATNDLFGGAAVPRAARLRPGHRVGESAGRRPARPAVRRRRPGCPTVTGLSPVVGPGGRRHDGHHHRVRASAPAPRWSASAGSSCRRHRVTPRPRSPWSPRTWPSAGTAGVTVTTTGRRGRNQPGRRRLAVHLPVARRSTSVVADQGPPGRGRTGHHHRLRVRPVPRR